MSLVSLAKMFGSTIVGESVGSADVSNNYCALCSAAAAYKFRVPSNYLTTKLGTYTVHML